MTPELQHTVGKAAGFNGTSLHTGEKVTLKVQPAPVNHGVKFKRKDLPDEPTIDARIDNLKMVERATTIGEGSVRVHTVEHVLSALSAMAWTTPPSRWMRTSRRSVTAARNHTSISSNAPA